MVALLGEQVRHATVGFGHQIVVRLTCNTTWFGSRPCASSETSVDVVVFMIVAALGREPLGPVPEVVFAMLWCNEIVDAVPG